MFCFKCGKKINKDMQHCPYCGSKTVVNKKSKALIKDEKESEEVVSIKPNKVEMPDFSTFFKNVGAFLYKYRQLFISSLALVLLLLFFCPFIKISLLGVTITEANGFQAIIELFKGNFFESIANGEASTSYIQNLISLAYLIYLVIGIALISLIIQNLVSIFKTKENVNKKNFRNFTGISVLSIALVVLFYVLKNEVIKVTGQALTFSGGTIAIMIVSLLPFVYSVVCRFCKFNQEPVINEGINFRKTHSSTVCMFYIVALFALFFKVASLPINEQPAVSLFEIINVEVYIFFVSLGLILTILFAFLNLNKTLHLLNILTNIVLISLLSIFLKDAVLSVNTLFYLPIILFAVSILYSLIYLIHIYKLEKIDPEALEYKEKLEEINSKKPKIVRINEIWINVLLFLGVLLCSISAWLPRSIGLIIWGVGLIIIVASIISVLIVDKKQEEFKLKRTILYKSTIALPILIITILLSLSNLYITFTTYWMLATAPLYYLIITLLSFSAYGNMSKSLKTTQNSKFIKYSNLVGTIIFCLLFAVFCIL